jgi:hypothetical protein
MLWFDKNNFAYCDLGELIIIEVFCCFIDFKKPQPIDY